jgi:hypothetical protein
MSLKVIKTDNRHTGSYLFKYYVVVPRYESINGRLVNFIAMREWCWETWGASCERDFHIRIIESELLNEKWCWHTDSKHEMRLYLKSETELNWLLLRWS